MASREEWCAEKSSNLQDEALRLSTLNEMREYLRNLPNEEASKTVHCLQVPLVFDCLNHVNAEQVDAACEVLALCLGNLSLGESTNRYGEPLERALTHSKTNVKIMALNEIFRSLIKEEALLEIIRRKSLLKNIICCIGDDELAVGKKACEIVVTLGLFPQGIKTLVNNELIQNFHELLEKNEVVRLRVFEVIMDISKENEGCFEELLSCGLADRVFQDLNNSDVLVKMNVIQLLTGFGLSCHGYNYLEKNSILKKLFSIFENGQDEMALQLCEPGILKLFGNLANLRPLQMLSNYPQMYYRIFNNLQSQDLTVVGISLDTLGFIGLETEGKVALDSTGNKMTNAFQTIITSLSTLPTEFRVRALNCLENLLSLNTHNNEISTICQKWFHLFGEVPLDLVIKYVNHPFIDVRTAGLGILKAIAKHFWGQETIKNSPGLVELLLDRNSETFKAGKELRYEIVEILSKSDVFDRLLSKQLQTFVNEGPFYVHTVTEVAIEGNE